MKEIVLGIAGVLLLATVVFASDFASSSLAADSTASSLAAELSKETPAADEMPATGSEAKETDDSPFESKNEVGDVPAPTTGAVITADYPHYDEGFKELWEQEGGLNEKFSESLVNPPSDVLIDPCASGAADCAPTPTASAVDPDPCSNGAADCAPTPTIDPCANNAVDLASCQPTPTPDPCASGAIDSAACACKGPFISLTEYIACICAHPGPFISLSAAQLYEQYCTAAPSATPTPTPPTGGETSGHDIFLGGGETGGVTEELEEVILLPQEKKNYLMVFADSMAYLGDSVQVKIVQMDSTKPLPGAVVSVYRQGQLVQRLTASENGVVAFPADALGVLTYEAAYPDLQQYNDPSTVVFAVQQIALQEEQTQETQPGGLTGLFTAVTGNWILLLLAALLGYAGYRNYAAKKK